MQPCTQHAYESQLQAKIKVDIRLRPFLENIFLQKFLKKNNFLEKFSRNSREIQISFLAAST
jgi:hypothetical protein